MTRSSIWWLYFAYCVGMFMWGFYLLASGGPVKGLALATSIETFVELFGLYHFIKGKPFLVRQAWVVVAALLSVRLTIATILLVNNILPWQGMSEQRVSVVGLAGMVAGIPLAYALWRYALWSPAIWRKAVQPGIQPDGPASGRSAG